MHKIDEKCLDMTEEGKVRIRKRRHKNMIEEIGENDKNEKEINPINNRPYTKNYYKLLELRKKLPVYGMRSEIIKTISENRVVIIEGATGSGKTTQIPRFVYEAGICSSDKAIVCTQPRRVAAISVATRVAEEMDIDLGNEIGYRVRFDAKESEKTKLFYMTDGLLMREFVSDENIDNFGAVIIDEAHERTINSDIIIGLLKLLMDRRSDLRVVVMSATLEAEKFKMFFDQTCSFNVPHIVVPGRLFRVKKVYVESPVQKYINEASARVIDIHFNKDPGDILVFLTGEEEIETFCTRIKDQIYGQEHPTGMSAYVLPLYASLPANEQAKIFRPAKQPNTRKIIVSTNIAETSLTIDGVVYVIDPGLVKQNRYIPERRMSALLVVPVSKASAQQRCGRAGRTREGWCYRLYTKSYFEKEMIEQTIPEIQRTDLCSVILLMLAAGITDIINFPLIDPPKYYLVKSAILELYYLGAIDRMGRLTESGKILANLPVDPKLAKVLLASSDYGCVKEAATIVSLMAEHGQIFFRPSKDTKSADAAHRQFKCSYSDHISMIRAFNAFENSEDQRKFCNENFLNYRVLDRAYKARHQILSLLRKYCIEISSLYETSDNSRNENLVLQALLSGLFMQVCKLNNLKKNYLFLTNQNEASIHVSSNLVKVKPEWVMYSEYVFTNTNCIRTVSQIDPQWLFHIQPEFYNPYNFAEGEVRHALVSIKKLSGCN